MTEALQWLRDNLSLAVIAGIIIAFAIPRVRDWLLVRFLGYAWRRITEPAREAERREALRTESQRELREAVGNLEEGLTTGGQIDNRARVQINQSLSVLERRWPDLKAEIHSVIVAAMDGEPVHLQAQRQLMRPFVERLRRELDEG